MPRPEDAGPYAAGGVLRRCRLCSDSHTRPYETHRVTPLAASLWTEPPSYATLPHPPDHGSSSTSMPGSATRTAPSGRLARADAHGRPDAGSPAQRLALRALQAGAVLVVLAAATYKVFELDRFFVPKELTLHL